MDQNTRATGARLSTTLRAMPALARLQELRLEQALSQDDLATLSGVNRTTIVRLEGGDPRARPSTVRKIARALRVKPAELMGK